jgi:hypothetical protein
MRLYLLAYVALFRASGRQTCAMTPKHHQIQWNATDPDAGYPDRLGPSGKFVENSTKLSCLEITGYRIKCSAVLWLLELQIRCGRKV